MSQTERARASLRHLGGYLAGLAAARLDSAAGLSRATHLGALAVDLADGAAPAEVLEGGHIEVEGLLLALGVAHTREVAVDVEEVVPVGLVPQGSGDVSGKVVERW